MGSLARKAIGGSIHKIREFELEKVSLVEEFDILQIVGEGWFGKILLVEHKATDTEMVLKALPKPYTALRDFYREFHYGLHLGAHKNIITTYDVAFETAGFYVFSQEYAPLGDLTSNVSETGIGELHTKRVARQLAAALEHLHSRDLVHRDVKLDNILVFKSDFSRVKLCDFGETRRSGSVVRRHNEWLPYAPPEVLRTANDDMYKAVTSHDVWQFAIVIFVCLTGCLPWQKAAHDDPRYARFVAWHCSAMPIRKQPKLFKLISSKAQRLFRKFLEPRIDKRPVTLTDVHRFLDDRWLAKNSSEKNNGLSTEDDGLCPSMYSYHSSPEEKNKLLHSLTQYGIEVNVDHCAKKDRIRAWIECSVIEEEDEDVEESSSEDEEHTAIVDNETGPIGERTNRGPVEDKRQQVVKDSARLEKQKRRERRYSAINRRSSQVYTVPIDPRIPLEKQRFSKSEMNLNRNYIFPSEDHIDKDAITQDDSTVVYTEKDNLDGKVSEIKHAIPYQNLTTINGTNKDSSPPILNDKQNDIKQNGVHQNGIKQNGAKHSPVRQNGYHQPFEQQSTSTSLQSVSFQNTSLQSVSYQNTSPQSTSQQSIYQNSSPKSTSQQSIYQNSSPKSTSQQSVYQRTGSNQSFGHPSTYPNNSQPQSYQKNISQPNLWVQSGQQVSGSTVQPGPGVQQNQLLSQTGSPMVQTGQSIVQAGQVMVQIGQSMVQSGHPVVQPSQSMGQSVQSNGQPNQSMSQPLQGVGQMTQPIAQQVQLNQQVQPGHSMVQPTQQVLQPNLPVQPATQPAIQPAMQPAIQPVQQLQQRMQPVAVTANLVENRRTVSSSKNHSHYSKKKPIKERYEAYGYGNFDYKINNSSNTGRSGSK